MMVAPSEITVVRIVSGISQRGRHTVRQSGSGSPGH